ncbi:hypothetical protein [Vibrio sonorensis]|uniref:hypothetical protein n=1 Tax=Vibrio sonorensis TaxID=1004316 RepID=UPI0008DA17BC|nr:hypothetical protein [Vibrio sonorensis]
MVNEIPYVKKRIQNIIVIMTAVYIIAAGGGFAYVMNSLDDSHQAIDLASQKVMQVYSVEMNTTWDVRLKLKDLLYNSGSTLSKESFIEDVELWHTGIVKNFIDDGSIRADKRMEVINDYYFHLKNSPKQLGKYQNGEINITELNDWFEQTEHSANTLEDLLQAFVREINSNLTMTLDEAYRSYETMAVGYLVSLLSLMVLFAMYASSYVRNTIYEGFSYEL